MIKEKRIRINVTIYVNWSVSRARMLSFIIFQLLKYNQHQSEYE